MYWPGILIIVLFLVLLLAAVLKTRRANPEQSSTEMHPDNFSKPKIERVEPQPGKKKND